MAKKYPTPGWLVSSQCDGKHRFANAGLAREVARRSTRTNGTPIGPYRCPHCGSWHVGGKTPPINLKKASMNNKPRERSHD